MGVGNVIIAEANTARRMRVWEYHNEILHTYYRLILKQNRQYGGFLACLGLQTRITYSSKYVHCHSKELLTHSWSLLLQFFFWGGNSPTSNLEYAIISRYTAWGFSSHSSVSTDMILTMERDCMHSVICTTSLFNVVINTSY